MSPTWEGWLATEKAIPAAKQSEQLLYPDEQH